MPSGSSTSSCRPVAASSRSPTSSTTTSPARASTARCTRVTGRTPGPSRRSCGLPSWPPPTTPLAVCRHRSPGRSAEVVADRSPSRLLVTGGAGFIGSAYVRDVLGRRDGTRIIVLDKLTYAGNRSNLASVEADPEQAARLRFVHGDIAEPGIVGPLVADADAVVNFAAESHVDRSILDPEAFLRTGVIGVHVLLEAVRAASRARTTRGDTPVRYLQVSTDEVYGSVAEGR